MNNSTDATEAVKLQKKLRKGDLVKYGATHISTFYSDVPMCTSDKNGNSRCTYEIIHASGFNYIDTNNNKIFESGEFSRRVVINANYSKPMPEPTGFGRIKLWD